VHRAIAGGAGGGRRRSGLAAAAAPPLTSEEARQQAQAEGLTLLVADNKAGYFGVHLPTPGGFKPYQAQVWRGGKVVSPGRFATAEEAALCVARSPEGQAAAERAASAPPSRRSEEEGQGPPPARPSRAVLKEEGTVPPMPAGAFVKEEELFPLMPPGGFFKEDRPSSSGSTRSSSTVVGARMADPRGEGRKGHVKICSTLLACCSIGTDVANACTPAPLDKTDTYA
jgi:hypothetical protein